MIIYLRNEGKKFLRFWPESWSVFDKKITNRTVLVFMFDENEKIKSISQFDLNDQKDIEYIKEKTPNNLLDKGFIEKIFGGVGSSIPTTTKE